MERLQKYYSGRSCNDNPGRICALAGFRSLLKGNTYNGKIFLMHSDQEMKKYLHPDDYAFWIEQKDKALGDRVN